MTQTAHLKRLAVVTGGAGFIGSHLCARLVREGYRVISLDNYSTGSVENHVSGVEYRTGHTKDISMLIYETPDILFHLGEYARTEKSFEDVERVWDQNLMGTVAVLEFVRRAKTKLVYAGSSTKFADNGAGKEQSPYAWSKATNTELVKNYGQWFGIRYAITYFYNVYGPREMSGPFGSLIGIFSQLYRQGQALTVVSPGTQVRNFTHVDDIVDGLILVGNKGEGDEFGIGSPEAYSVTEVAHMFGGEIIFLPERKGNRLTSEVKTEKTIALGWQPSRHLTEYINETKNQAGVVRGSAQRVLVFSTTFFPDQGKAEESLVDVIRAMPNVHFDVVTTVFSAAGKTVTTDSVPVNATVYRVGFGRKTDKYLLPVLGGRVARTLLRKNQYAFLWSLFASYGALTALLARVNLPTPLLITIADQKLDSIPFLTRWILGGILGQADQVYADDTYEARSALTLAKRATLVRSIGKGDAFANQVRFAYSTFLRKRTQSHET
jgi:UDP-glucose 4-epimerase